MGEVDSTVSDWPGRWANISKILERRGPLTPPSFQPSPELLPFLLENIKVLVVGAGGLGCELLKNLAMMGFRNISVIDADTIDLTNLNRQFLFRKKDIGRNKSDVAADSIKERLSHLNLNITSHVGWLQDKDDEF